LLPFGQLRADALSVDYPVDKADEPGAADDIAECNRDEIVDDPRYRNKRCIEISGHLANFRQQPSQRQKIHIGDAMLEASRDDCRDRQY